MTSPTSHAFQMISILVQLIAVHAQVIYPPGCTEATFPDAKECLAKNWDLGPNAVDKCAPQGPYPVWGEQVYIKDPHNFCMALPSIYI